MSQVTTGTSQYPKIPLKLGELFSPLLLRNDTYSDTSTENIFGPSRHSTTM